MSNAVAQRRAPRRWIYWMLAVVSAAFFALISFRGTPQQSAIRELAEAERRALYQRTLDTLAGPCADATRPAGLTGFCRQQAEFIRQFPECDAACDALAEQHHRLPTR